MVTTKPQAVRMVVGEKVVGASLDSLEYRLARAEAREVAAWRALPIPGGRVVLVAGIVALLVAVFRAWRVERQRSVGVQSERWDSVVTRLASLSDEERAAVRRVVVTGTDRDPRLERVARETQLVQRHYVGGHYEVSPAVAAELQRWAGETPPDGQDRSR